MERYSIVPIVLGVILFQASNAGRHEGVQCNGYCTDDIQKCKTLGGRIMGFCTNSLACCDPLIHSSAKCGDVKSGQRIIHIKSPGYPSFASGDLNCIVKIDILKDNVATRVDFIHAEMDGPSFAESENESGHCESDLVFLRGFQSWAPPPRCGNLSGYSFLIDRDTPQTKDMKSLTILSLMASPAYRWHIRVVQLLRTKKLYPNQNSVYDSDTPVFNKGKRSLLNPLPVKEKVWSQPLDLDEAESDQLEKFAQSQNPRTTDADKKKLKFIFNGEDTLIKQVPWQVSFRYKLESLSPDEVNEKLNSNCSIHEGFHFCGGSIIGENLILTASHCFYGTSKTNGMVDLALAKAVVGDTNLCRDSENDPTSFDYDIESVTMHYGYDSNLLINDIAIVKLKSRIEFKDYIKPITLAKTGDDFSETTALLSGWGDYLKPGQKEEVEANISGESSSTPPPLNYTTGESLETFPTSSTTELPQITTKVVEDMQNDIATPMSTSTSDEARTKMTTSTMSSTSFDDILTETMTPPPDESLPEMVTSTLASTTSITTLPPQNASAIEEETFVVETPSILQSSRRFFIQNRTVCNGKDIEQYSASKDTILKYVKYHSLLDSTICTLSLVNNEEPNFKPVSTGKGDSGGGLVVYPKNDGSSQPVQVGVVSYGVADSESQICDVSNNKSSNGTFDFFSSVAFYRNWIDLVVLSHENGA